METSKTSEESIVILLDILGFKELIKEDNQSKILPMLQYFVQWNQTAQYENLNNIKPEISSYSDHIVISISLEQLNTLNFQPHNTDPLFQYIHSMVSHFYIFALTKGMALRGAIDKGKLYHDNNIIFGEVLVNCFELEKKANLPRVILSDLVFDFFKKNEHCSYLISSAIKNDGSCCYLDSFKSLQMFHFEDNGIENFRLIHGKITNNIKKLVGGPKEKWEWLAKSYNEALIYWRNT